MNKLISGKYNICICMQLSSIFPRKLTIKTMKNYVNNNNTEKSVVRLNVKGNGIRINNININDT